MRLGLAHGSGLDIEMAGSGAIIVDAGLLVYRRSDWPQRSRRLQRDN